MKLLLFTILLLISAPAAQATADDWATTTLQQMTLDQKLGQILVAEVPARADRDTRDKVRTWVKRYHIGGLRFTAGTPEEQAILTNLAQKTARIPLMLPIGGKRRLGDYLEGVPTFPNPMALQCLADEELRSDYAAEEVRQLQLLGMQRLDDRKLVEVTTDVPGTVARMKSQLQGGRLSLAAVDEMCLRVLRFKQQHGLMQTPAPLQVSGMSFRLCSDESRQLAETLRNRAVTLMMNHFDLLPLQPVDGEVGLLSIGTSAQTLRATLSEHYRLRPLSLQWGATDAERSKALSDLAGCRRVIIALGDSASASSPASSALNPFLARPTAADLDFLRQLRLDVPVVYLLLAPHRFFLPMAEAFSHSSAAVLAHSAQPEVQRQVALLVAGKAGADARLSVNIGWQFPVGSGCTLQPDAAAMTAPRPVPEDYGLKAYQLPELFPIVQEGLEQGAYPGCTMLLLKDDAVLCERSWGTAANHRLYDLGQLTMPMATLVAVMKLVDEGKLSLDDRVSRHLPQLARTNKRDITLRQLIRHESGVLPHYRFYLDLIDPKSVNGPYSQSWKDEWHTTQVSEHGYFCSDFRFRRGLTSAQRTSTHTLQMADGLWLNKSFKATMMNQLATSELNSCRRLVSDLGYVLLQQVVEAVARQPLDRYLAQHFYEPMGLKRLAYRPLGTFTADEVMPTAKNDYLRRQDLCGNVYDETAACLGGVAGNAGLFGTARDVATLFGMLLQGGTCEGKRYLSAEACREIIGTGDVAGSVPGSSATAKGSTASSIRTFTGFTGTYVGIDPAQGTVLVFLTNRLCPEAWNTRLLDLGITARLQQVLAQ